MSEKIILDVLRTEKSVSLTEFQHTIPFVVSLSANKNEIKNAIEEMFKVKVEKVRTHIRKGKKIAYVQFAPEVNMEELATQLKLA
ncbi:MAG: 50S ribosomal protein L23 [Candidatus Anstonellales archaeon]